MHTTLERFSLSLCERGNGGVYLQHTIAPGTANGGVCVRTPVPLSSRTLGFGFSPTYVTYFHRVYVDSIYPLSKESSVCVCVCVLSLIHISEPTRQAERAFGVVGVT